MANGSSMREQRSKKAQTISDMIETMYPGLSKSAKEDMAKTMYDQLSDGAIEEYHKKMSEGDE
jgi:hypothetical protein